jgi:hypothetical protein
MRITPWEGFVMKRALVLFAVAIAGAVFAARAAAAPTTGSLLISHFTRGCHNWSLNGGPYTPNQHTTLARGGSLLITNDDLMVQDLVQTSGPAAQMRLVRQSHMGSMRMAMPMNGQASPYAMAHMGAQLRVTFPQAGQLPLQARRPRRLLQQHQDDRPRQQPHPHSHDPLTR